MPESLRKSREQFETKLKQKVGEVVPEAMRDDFWAYYDIWREQVREKVMMNMGYAHALDLGGDAESVTIESVLNVWTREEQERREKQKQAAHHE